MHIIADDITLRIYGKPNKTFLKFWKENSREAAPPLFRRGTNVNFYAQDVNTLKPDTEILKETPKYWHLFSHGSWGNKDIDKAPIVAWVNNDSDFGIGSMGWGYDIKPFPLLERPTYGFIYQENFNVDGVHVMTFNANSSGGGVMWATKNCKMTSGKWEDYAVDSVSFDFSLSDDTTDFNLPQDIEAFVINTNVHHDYWPAMQAVTSRSSLFQVEGKGADRFCFIIPNDSQVHYYLQQINGYPINTKVKAYTDTGKLMCGVIPKVGDTITLSREYVTNLNFNEMDGGGIPDPEKLDYTCEDNEPCVRSHIAWTTVRQEYGNEFGDVKLQGGKYLQVGDQIKRNGVTHTVTKKKRGYYVCSWGGNQSGYCMEFKPTSRGKVHCNVYENYELNPPLEIDESSSVLCEFEVIKSRAAYLMEGDTYKGSFTYMTNHEWSQTKDQVIKSKSVPIPQTFYCHRELNHHHEGSDFSEAYYRENNLNYKQIGGEDYEITDPDTGQPTTVRSLWAYPYFGSQHIDCKTPTGQYGGGYNEFMPQRDKLLRSQGLDEEYLCMQRNIGNVTQGQKVDEPYYTTTEQRPLPQRLTNFIASNRR